MTDRGRLILDYLRGLDSEDRTLIRRELEVDERPSEPNLSEPLLTVQEAATLAGCHAETIRRAVRAQRLPAGRVGRSPRISRTELDRWLQGAPGTRERPSRRLSARRSTKRRPMRDAMLSTLK